MDGLRGLKQYVVAFDPGKVNDPSAIQVYRGTPVFQQPDNIFTDRGRTFFRDDLVMQYQIQSQRHTEVARFVADLMRREHLVDTSVLIFDATGVGQAVKDMLYEEGVRSMLPVVYTAGGSVTYRYRDSQADQRFSMAGQQGISLKVLDEVHVPKNDMVDAARLAMELQEVRVVQNLPYLQQFKLQMEEFTGKMNKKGYTSYNNSSDDIHDEWVNCLMMRSWYRQRFRKSIDALQGEYKPKEQYADILGW